MIVLLSCNHKKRDDMEKTILQIEGINANEFLTRFEALEKGLEQLKNVLTPQNKGKENEDFITRTETAKLLKVTVATVSDWAKKKVLKSYKCGNRVYFKRSEINEAIQKGGIL